MKVANLGEYVKIKTGKLDANASNVNGKYPFFTCSNEPLKINDYSYDCECVLVAGNGDLNVKYYNGKFNAYQRTYIIESKDKSILNTKYLYYLINANIEQLRKNAIGGVIKYIKLGNLTNIKFKLTEINKQNYIVEELDKVQEIIDLRRKQMEALDELIESQFVEMYGNKNFKHQTLNEVSVIRGEYGSGSSAGEYIEGQPRYVRITDIQDDGSLDKNSLASPRNEKNIDKYILKYGDLLFARTGATVGKTYKYNENDGYCIYAGYCIRFRLNLEICNPDYIFIYTKTDNYKKWVENKQRIVAQPNINAKEYGNDLKIPIPPIELQTQFSEFVKQINNQKFILEKSLKATEELQESLMNKYFGE